MPRPEQAGFTLLEVLVAFVIAALALGVFFQGTLAGLRSAKVASQYEEALSLARSHLAEVSQRQVAAAVDSAGSDGPVFHYTIKARSVAQAQLQRSLLDIDNNKPARMANLYALEVTESWSADGTTRRVRLKGESMVVQGQGS